MQVRCFNFLVRIVLESLSLQKLSKDSSLTGFRVSYKPKTVFQDSHGQNIWDKL